MNKLLLLFLITSCQYYIVKAQSSADSRICNCFSQSLAADFMNATKANFGTQTVKLEGDITIRPVELQPIKFTLPLLPVKMSCTAEYSIYVTDKNNRKVHESKNSFHEISYRFIGCGEPYYVKLTVRAKSKQGSDGNCARSMNFIVQPVCNTMSCNCGVSRQVKNKTGTTDFIVTGKMQKRSTVNSEINYLLIFDVTNNTDCALKLQSITVHGQTIEVPPYKIAPKSTLKNIRIGFSTPESLSPPADANVLAVVRYSLNEERKCTGTIQIPYNN